MNRLQRLKFIIKCNRMSKLRLKLKSQLAESQTFNSHKCLKQTKSSQSRTTPRTRVPTLSPPLPKNCLAPMSTSPGNRFSPNYSSKTTSVQHRNPHQTSSFLSRARCIPLNNFKIWSEIVTRCLYQHAKAMSLTNRNRCPSCSLNFTNLTMI